MQAGQYKAVRLPAQEALAGLDDLSRFGHLFEVLRQHLLVDRLLELGLHGLVKLGLQPALLPVDGRLQLLPAPSSKASRHRPAARGAQAREQLHL